MTLSDYLDEKKLTVAEFAKLVGVSRAYIMLLRNGDRTNPAFSIAKKIALVTDNLVPLESWAAASETHKPKTDERSAA